MEIQTKAVLMREAVGDLELAFINEGRPKDADKVREAFTGLPDESAARLFDILTSYGRR